MNRFIHAMIAGPIAVAVCVCASVCHADQTLLDEILIFNEIVKEGQIQSLMAPEKTSVSEGTWMTAKEAEREAVAQRRAAQKELMRPARERVANDALSPWAAKKREADVPKRHVEEIGSARHVYTVTHGGTMDGENCRGPMGCGMHREGAIEQVWQSNRALRMENVGETDVVNPWLSNGRNLFRNLDEIVAAALTPDMTDREKALALWFQQTRYRYHKAGNSKELGDPVKVFNVYGHNPCGCDANIMGALWGKVGIKAGPVRLLSHAIAQAWYDEGWHVMDGDLDNIFLLRDNHTVAGDQALARDHDLIKRTHTMGILMELGRPRSESAAAMFVCEEPVTGRRGTGKTVTMDMKLRPGEAITWRWGHLEPVRLMWSNTGPNYPDTVCNGLWEYRPDLTGGLWRNGADKVVGIRSDGDGLKAEAGQTGMIEWAVRSPYVFVGGSLEIEGEGAEFAVSFDGKEWKPVGPDLDRLFPSNGEARFGYRLRCTLKDEARLKRLKILNDIQTALLTMPELVVGKNTLTYTDESPGERKVRVSHEWVERSASRPPEAPPHALNPPDKGEHNGTDVVFQWVAPRAPDGHEIKDYHFILSERPDMRFPLSMDFYKLISRTRDKGKPQYTLPYVGLLTPDTTYYWRVRAKDEKGVWGPWSKTWSFVPRGPAYPVDVAMNYAPDKGVGILTWKPNPVGRRPAMYRVYGSDEKGFSVSDKPYRVQTGGTRELRNPFPANFVAETSQPELQVVGEGLALPNSNKAYYRVVAVDGEGKRSWSSDFVEAPRPFIYSSPVQSAKVGEPYRYEAKSIRSLGDFRLRTDYDNRRFWDIEQPVYALASPPAWLSVDSRTGVLSGTPDVAGDVRISLTAKTDLDLIRLDLNSLGWGQVKKLGKSTRHIGSTTQEFVIRVGE
ncbi:MAG: hypothetical protein JXR37_18225 [Kiritimatiellae bacterium]|nr:hypothetical protein [Kiritimatiellia bacterium]